MKTINLSPNPISLIQSMRDIGYSLDTAVADIIDNSITANGENIHIRFDWNMGIPWLAIIDNGNGMTEDTLISAMRLGSQNPLEKRDLGDLGRFGLGLKTASFSQCRKLSVLTKVKNKVSCAQWDMDSLTLNQNNEWTLYLLSDEEVECNNVLSSLKKEYFSDNNSGTIVLWENIDRIVESHAGNSSEHCFNEVLSNVREHLGLVFHRYLSPSLGKTKIYIYFNNHPIDAFDPFNIKQSTELRYEEFKYEGAMIKVQPYILPHHNKVSKTDWEKYAGNQGYLHGQGFYIYRNRRLIIYANWFKLMKKEELTKLLRVKVDIPNTLDHLWKIDVKKSNAFPPEGVRDNLKRIIGKIEISGKKVYKQRGQKINDNITHPAWKRIARDNQIFYVVNKKHPIVEKFIDKLAEKDIEEFNSILSIIETTFPRDAFYHDSASMPEQVSYAKVADDQLKLLLKMVLGDKPKNVKSKLEELLQMEPFASNESHTKNLIKELGYELYA